MTKQHIMKALSGVVLATMLFTGISTNVYAETTGTVAVDSAKVRAEASTTSNTVTAAAKGTTVTVLDQTTDASGNVWYEVSISDGTKGYIRSDLLKVEETVEETAEESTEENASEDSEGSAAAMDTAGVDINSIAIPDDVEAMDFQMATIKVAAGKVRGGSSTKDNIVATLADGDKIVAAGSKTADDSKTWYFVAFVDGGSQKTGYIRSDLITLGDVIVVEQPEEEPQEEEPEVVEEPEPVNNDYELVFTDDGTGTEVWYLYNHIDNTREKLQELLDFANNQQTVQAKTEAQIKTFKIIIIALAAFLVIAIVIIIILLIRSRNGGYYDYDDDDDDDDYDDDDDDDEEEEEEVVERPMQNAARRRAAQGNAPRKPVSYDMSEDETQLRPKKKPDRKPKNFVLDDDDFEFEFLNMDDK